MELLKSMPGVPVARALLDLLEQARPRWEHAVVVGTSMLDYLLFHVPGDDHYPFQLSVRVAWADERFAMRLLDRSQRVITADFCLAPKAGIVLDGFLLQLTGSSGDIPEH
jgi:hypothetical protein